MNDNPIIVKVKSGRNGPVIRNAGINMTKKFKK